MSISNHSPPLRFSPVSPKYFSTNPDAHIIQEVSSLHSRSIRSHPLNPKFPEQPLDFEQIVLAPSSSRNERSNLLNTNKTEPINKFRDFSLNPTKEHRENFKTYIPRATTTFHKNAAGSIHEEKKKSQSNFLRIQAEVISKKLNITVKSPNLSTSQNPQKELQTPEPRKSADEDEETRKKSFSNPGIIRFLVLNDHANVLIKAKMILQKIFLSHVLAVLITYIRILAQMKVASFCWLEVCPCNNDFKIKLYSTFTDFFFYWVLYLVLVGKSVLIIKVFQGRWFKFLVYGAISTFIWLFYLLMPESEFNSLYIYCFVALTCFTLNCVYLVYLRFQMKLWLSHIFKINSLIFIVFVNHLLLRICFESFLDWMVGILSLDENGFWAKNMKLSIAAVYFKILSWLLKKLLFIFYSFLKACKHKNSQTLIGLCRYVLCFIVSFNVAGLIKMNSDDIGGWFLLITYILFVFSAYININLKEILIDLCFFLRLKSAERVMLYINRKIRAMLTWIENFRKRHPVLCLGRLFNTPEPNRPSANNHKNHENLDSKTMNSIKFERMFAGAVLDIVLVCSFRLIVWFATRRWTLWFYTRLYYRNCEFEMSTDFRMTEVGFISILCVNFAVTILVLVYMFRKKRVLFDYKLRNYTIYNTYFLVLMHTFFEGMIQSIYSIS